MVWECSKRLTLICISFHLLISFSGAWLIVLVCKMLHRKLTVYPDCSFCLEPSVLFLQHIFTCKTETSDFYFNKSALIIHSLSQLFVMNLMNSIIIFCLIQLHSGLICHLILIFKWKIENLPLSWTFCSLFYKNLNHWMETQSSIFPCVWFRHLYLHYLSKSRYHMMKVQFMHSYMIKKKK